MELPDHIALDAVETRVLGALIEKQLTTPDTYPLTLNALTAACNQTSNRHPVVTFDAREVEAAVMELKGKALARVVHPGSGERATKYRQVADEALELGSAERALLGVLLLRGAQTAGELRSRTDRMHAFDSPGAVEATLEAMAARERPLVAHVGRLPGQKEGRWVQLLEEGAIETAATSAPATAARSSRSELEDRVAALEARLARMEEALGDLLPPRSDAPDP